MQVLETRKIVFITGAFVTHRCWDPWRTYFEDHGYETVAPPWPYKDMEADVLRDRQPYDIDLAQLTLNELINHYSHIVREYEVGPIIIGHSLGGLITQILV